MATCAPCSASEGPSCPVCFRDYGDSDAVLVPRILNCGHTFCTECLERLLKVSNEEKDELDSFMSVLFGTRDPLRPRIRSIDHAGPTRTSSHDLMCPICKSSNHVQGGDVSNLTKNFALLCLRDGGGGAGKGSKHYCREHEHEQRIYCQQCQVLVCAYCQLYGLHKAHECVIASEVCQPAVDGVKAVQVSVCGDLEQVQAGEMAVLKSLQKFQRQQNRCEHRVSRYYDKLIAALQREKEKELGQVKTWANEQAFVLHSQLQLLVEMRQKYESLIEECKAMVEHDTLQCLAEKDSLVQRAKELNRSVAGMCFESLISPSLSSQLVGSAARTKQLLHELLKGIRVDMRSDIMGEEEGEQGEKKEEESDEDQHADFLSTSDGSVGGSEARVQLLHAQDTHHDPLPSRLELARGLPTLDPAAFPADPNAITSPTLSSCTSLSRLANAPTPSITPPPSRRRSTRNRVCFPFSHDSPSPSSSDQESGGEYRQLTFHQPLPFLITATPHDGYNVRRYHMSPDEADDEEEVEEEREDTARVSAMCPSPPPSVHLPSIASPNAQRSWTEEHSVSVVSVGGPEMYVSIATAGWPVSPFRRSLADEGPTLLAGPPFDMEEWHNDSDSDSYNTRPIY